MRPEGLELQTEFLDVREEQELLAWMAGIAWGEVRMHGVTARRRVKQFGWHYSFDSYRLTPAAPLPEELVEVRRRAAEVAQVAADEFAETPVTEYLAGAGIGWHRDAPPFGIVAGISLGAACRMRFQRGEGAARETAAVELPARSIYLLTGPARDGGADARDEGEAGYPDV